MGIFDQQQNPFVQSARSLAPIQTGTVFDPLIALSSQLRSQQNDQLIQEQAQAAAAAKIAREDELLKEEVARKKEAATLAFTRKQNLQKQKEAASLKKASSKQKVDNRRKAVLAKRLGVELTQDELASLEASDIKSFREESAKPNTVRINKALPDGSTQMTFVTMDNNGNILSEKPFGAPIKAQENKGSVSSFKEKVDWWSSLTPEEQKDPANRSFAGIKPDKKTGGKAAATSSVLNKLTDQSSETISFVKAGNRVIQHLRENPESMTFSEEIGTSGLARVKEEISAAAKWFGADDRDRFDKQIDAMLEKTGNTKAAEAKSQIKAIIYSLGASYGQSGRSMSDKDLKRFTEIIVGNYGDRDAIIANLSREMDKKKDDFSTKLNIKKTVFSGLDEFSDLHNASISETDTAEPSKEGGWKIVGVK